MLTRASRNVLGPRGADVDAHEPLTAAARQRLANALDYASDRGVTLEPISDLWGSLTRTDAYVIQALVTVRKQQHGAAIAAHKIGMVAPANCRELGMDDPTSGPIFEHQLLPNGSRLSVGTLIRPRLEAEVALLLGSDLRAPVTAADVLAATRAVVPVVEILDTRVSWSIRSEDSIADLASSGRVVLGDPLPVPAPAALEDARVGIHSAGVEIRSGRARAIGGIAASAARLVNDLGARGQDARAGQLLLAGAFCAAAILPRGRDILADFGPLGTVRLRTV